jgi:hypothetical protein
MKKSAHSYLLYLLMSYVLAEERVEYGRYFFERIIGILRAGQVVLWVLGENHFSRPATAFTSFSALILLNHDE